MGGITPGGLPYPSPTEPVAQGADAIRALAEAIDTLRLVPKRLEASSAIQQVTDCNSALNAGWYIAANASNSPTSTASGVLFVYRGGTVNAQYVRQEFRRLFVDSGTGLEDTRVWTRTSMASGAGFSAWTLIIEDTGWNPISSMSNGFVAAPGLAYRRIGGVVYVKGEVTNSTQPTALTTAFTMPTGFRPDYRMRVVNFASDYASPFAVSFETNGQVQISASFAKPSTPGYNLAMSYPAAP